MKNFKRNEWERKRIEIINEINSISNRKFRTDDFVEKIKRNIPINSTNKDGVIESLSAVGKGGGSIHSIGNGNSSGVSYGPSIDQQKKDLIEILNLIELKKFRIMKNMINFLRKKVDWKWLAGIILAIIALLIKYIGYE